MISSSYCVIEGAGPSSVDPIRIAIAHHSLFQKRPIKSHFPWTIWYSDKASNLNKIACMNGYLIFGIILLMGDYYEERG